MKNNKILLIFLLSYSITLSCIKYYPVITYNKEYKTIEYILDNRCIVDTLKKDAEFDFSKFGVEFQGFKVSSLPKYKIVDSISTNSDIFVLSDIHGQFKPFIQLLLNSNIIDESYNWKFENNILLIDGDTFDRGDDVRKIFWFLYKLKTQAENQNGLVLHLIGNHELMILRKDLRYVSDNCMKSAESLGYSYSDLYSSKTFLGSWIRSFSTILKIDDNIFVHAGISKKLVDSNISIPEINRMVIRDFDFEHKFATDKQNLVFKGNGPLWYRGYFKNEISINDFNNIILRLNAENIIVGHTTQDSLETFFNNRLFAIDAGLKYGEKGEALFISDDNFYRIDFLGNKHRIK